ncbi:MAG: hypothetical protein DF168_01107 [Candidatus Moanabacter tarae]|uniref:VWFA domain-containing protein n=1 Tax=Candidatus Moanibacter tarae TaxID=2200854 RepID=A0A2Z4ALN9_9BACT|nr:MAG: hypothetical protein DF168_01107 [Candidatus Moanabacter tarae]|tara:strand:- start:629 stop:1690 length:1062 start_codon:yes stop_codon:yes gene_type:complete
MKKNRGVTSFSISFLDCISCGFGAIILLFVLTSGKKVEDSNQQLSDKEVDLGALRRNIQDEEQDLLRLSVDIEEIRKRVKILETDEIEIETKIEDKTLELRLLLEQLAEMEELRDNLLARLEKLPTVEEAVPIPVPNPVRRQYLTEFKLDGERVIFLIESSGGMLDANVELAIERSTGTKEEKRSAPKWKRTMRAVEWLFTSLKPPSRYQIYFFGKETESIYPTRAFDWMDMSDRKQTAETLKRLREKTPQGPANLEKAFYVIGNLDPLPDNIILLVDGLPTQGESVKAGHVVDTQTRIRMFNAAKRAMPRGVPLNIILLPWSGDPEAASMYWLMATETDGSFICPARDWPTI